MKKNNTQKTYESIRKPMHRPGHTHDADTDYKRRTKFKREYDSDEDDDLGIPAIPQHDIDDMVNEMTRYNVDNRLNRQDY